MIMEEKKVCMGTVVWFRGIGFIKPDNSETDIFVHYSDIAMEGYKTLTKGQRVSYEIGLNNRGQDKAVNVIAIK
jgi:CspA family cold shock protein